MIKTSHFTFKRTAVYSTIIARPQFFECQIAKKQLTPDRKIQLWLLAPKTLMALPSVFRDDTLSSRGSVTIMIYKYLDNYHDKYTLIIITCRFLGIRTRFAVSTCHLSTFIKNLRFCLNLLQSLSRQLISQICQYHHDWLQSVSTCHGQHKVFVSSPSLVLRTCTLVLFGVLFRTSELSVNY